jgi:hypothetical protein
MRIAPALLVLACVTACVAKPSGDTPSAGGRVDPSWIDDWHIAVQHRTGIPPAPSPVNRRLQQPDSLSAAMNILFAREVTDPDSLNGVYNTVRDDVPFAIRVMHERWTQTPADRRLIAEVYLGLAEHGIFPVTWSGDTDQSRSSVAGRSIDLLGAVLDYDADLRRKILAALSRLNYLRWNVEAQAVLLERLASAPANELAVWGGAISDFEKFPDETRKVAYDAIIEALKQWGGPGAPHDRSLTPPVSHFLGNRIARNPSPEGARALAEFIRVRDYRPDELAWPLNSLDPAWPETQPAIAAALAKDDRDLVIAALRILEANGPLRAEHRSRVRALAASFRPDIREAARAALPADEPPPPMPETFVLPGDTAATLLAMLPFDLSRAQRVKARALVQSEWGSPQTTEKPVLGWLLLGGNGVATTFISDDLDITPAGSMFASTPVDFAAEVDEAIASGPGASESDRGWDHSASGWVTAFRSQDLLLLLCCVAREQQQGADTLPKSSQLYLNALSGYASETALIESIARVLATAQYLQCVHCFALGADDFALEHAAGMRACLGWTGWWHDKQEYLEQVSRIESDIAQRRTTAIKARRHSLEYWLERMPDLRIAQMGQPGPVIWAHDDREVLHGIASYGLGALLPLCDLLDDTRLIRGCGFWRDFAASRQLFTVGDAASMIMNAICRHFLGTELAYTVWAPEHREELRDWLERAVAAAASSR